MAFKAGDIVKRTGDSSSSGSDSIENSQLYAIKEIARDGGIIVHTDTNFTHGWNQRLFRLIVDKDSLTDLEKIIWGVE